jgi:uncharacterized protein (DUF952 family)
MRKFRKVPKMTCHDVAASVYEGEGDRLFVLVEESDGDHSIALEPSEAAALRNFLGAALGIKASDADER